MNLIKTSMLSLIATGIKLLSALIINKAIALYIGPSGLAIVGQFQNFMQFIMTASQGGVSQGVTKYIAEYSNENTIIKPLLSTASQISLSASILIGALVILFSIQLSDFILNTNKYWYVFVLLGATTILFVANQLLLSVLNGLKEIKTFISINIMQSLYSLIFTTIMIVWLKIDGALIAMVTNQSVILLVVIWMLRRHDVIKISNFTGKFNRVEGKKLFKFSAMAFTSILTVPLSQMLIRNYLGDNLGWNTAGYWQAIWYISSMYLMIVTTALSIYYLPRLSEIADKTELKKEIISGYKIIMPLVASMALLIFYLKDFIIQTLFSEDFTPMRELFKWQLIGDVIKMASWLLAYLMLAKAMTKVFIFTEIVFSFLFVLLTMMFVDDYGVIGVTYAFALNYSIYFLFMFFFMRKKLFK